MSDEPLSISVAELLDFGEMSPKDARQIRALNAFAQTGTASAACRLADVSRWSWGHWRRTDPAFNALVRKLIEVKSQFRGERVEDIEERLYQLAEEGNLEAIKVVLKAEMGKYRDKQVIEVVSPDVQNRLRAQADAIMLLCATELPEPYRSQFPAKLAAKLEEIWA